LLDGCAVNCHISGEGSPILYLHGFGGSHKSFMPVILGMRGRMAVAPDLPGFGESDDPKTAYGVEDYARAVIGLMNELKISSADIIAHSFGGRIAIYLLANFPDRFKRALLCGCAGLRPRRGPRYYFKVYSYKLKKFLKKRGLLAGTDLSGCGSSDYRSLSPAMKATFVKIVNQNLKTLLPKVVAPVLLVYGDGDRATPLSMAKTFEKNIRGSALIVMKGCGHFAYLDSLREFLLIAQSFLGV